MELLKQAGPVTTLAEVILKAQKDTMDVVEQWTGVSASTAQQWMDMVGQGQFKPLADAFSAATTANGEMAGQVGGCVMDGVDSTMAMVQRCAARFESGG